MIRAPVFVRALLLFVCVPASASLKLSANHVALHDQRSGPRVAILFRGEAYRAVLYGGHEGERAQVGSNKRRACEDDSFENQQSYARQHMEIVRKLENLGLTVDMFGMTYNCQNGKDYVGKLKGMYAPNMRVLDVLAKPGSSQLSGMAHVMNKALTSGEKYDAYYLMRWDYTYPELEGMNAIGCFLDKEPRDENDFRSGNEDVLIYMPAAYAARFMLFMEEGAHLNGCCAGECPQACNVCVPNFRRAENVTANLLGGPCVSPAPFEGLISNKGIDHTDDDCIEKEFPDSAGYD